MALETFYMIPSRSAIEIRVMWTLKDGGGCIRALKPYVGTRTTRHVHRSAWNKMAAWHKACYICLSKSWTRKRSSVFEVPKHWRSNTAPTVTSENCNPAYAQSLTSKWKTKTWIPNQVMGNLDITSKLSTIHIIMTISIFIFFSSSILMSAWPNHRESAMNK